MKFIGRQRELESLEREYQKDSSFVVIYGRRRVGKTTLIKEFIKSKLAFYFLATEEVESQSIKRLSGVVSRVTRNPLLQRAAFSDWLDLFHIIAEFRPEEKKVLVIDEFPYLVKSNPAFPSNSAKRMGRSSQGQQCDADSLRLLDWNDAKTRAVL